MNTYTHGNLYTSNNVHIFSNTSQIVACSHPTNPPSTHRLLLRLITYDTYTYIYIYIHTCTYICVCVFTCLYVYRYCVCVDTVKMRNYSFVHTQPLHRILVRPIKSDTHIAHIYPYVYIHIYIYVFMCMHTHVYLCIYVYVYIYTHIAYV